MSFPQGHVPVVAGHDEEEEDICRICRSPAEPGAPLYHPCNCSGSIKYIHEDCLMTWLKSQAGANGRGGGNKIAKVLNQSCETCGMIYHFKKVYSPHTPAHVPNSLLLLRSVQQAGTIVRHLIRAVIVVTLWLVGVPLTVRWIWVYGFSIANPLARILANYLTDARVPPYMSTEDEGVAPEIWGFEKGSFGARLIRGHITCISLMVIVAVLFMFREWLAGMRMEEIQPEDERDENGDEIALIAAMDEAKAEVEAEEREAENQRQLHHVMPEEVVHLNGEYEEEAEDEAEQQEKEVDEEQELEEQYRKEQLRDPQHLDELRNQRAAYFAKTTTENPIFPQNQEEYEQFFTLSSRDTHQQRHQLKPRPPHRNLTEKEDANFSQRQQDNSIFNGISSAEDTGRQSQPSHEESSSAEAGPSNPAKHSDTSISLTNPFGPDSPTAPIIPTTESVYSALLNGKGKGRATLEDLKNDEEDVIFRGPNAENINGSGLLTDSASGFTPSPHGQHHDPPPPHLPESDEDEPDPDPLRPHRQRMLKSNTPSTGSEDPEAWEDEEEEDLMEDEPVPPLLPLGALDLVPPQPFFEEEDEEEEMADDPGFGRGDPQEFGNEDEEDLGRIGDEEMDIVLDILGLRGPLRPLLINVALVTAVFATAITVMVLIPFLIGKFALLANWLKLYTGTLKLVSLVRKITDPLIDYLFIMPLKWLLPKSITLPRSKPVSDVPKLSSFKSLKLKLEKIPEYTVHLVDQADFCGYSITSSVCKHISPTMESIGKYVRTSYEWVTATIATMDRISFAKWSLGDSPTDRTIAITSGWLIVIGSVLVWCMLRSDAVKGPAKAVRDFMYAQGVALKLIVFMLIELVVFPLLCGFLIGFCTLPLLPTGAWSFRADFNTKHPIIACFLHWMLGTIFMFGFAQLLGVHRETLRKGVFYIIRDPQDPTFHPVREIMQRKTLSQLHKLTVSAMMYGCVISMTFGASLLIIKSIIWTALPLRWDYTVSLSQIPIDLLVLHFILPHTMHYVKPTRRFKKFVATWWLHVAHALRLTAFFIRQKDGHSVLIEDEIDTPLKKFIDVVVKFGFRDNISKPGGIYARVPAADQVVIIPKTKMFIQTTPEGVPLTKEGHIRMKAQNSATIRRVHTVEKDFQVMWIPSHFRNRIWLSIFLVWLTTLALIIILVLVPVMIGRGIFSMFIDHHVHDIYSFIVGSYVLWSSYGLSRWASKKAQKMFKAERLRRSTRSIRLKRSLFFASKLLYLALTFGTLVPLMLSTIVDLYVIFPFKFNDADDPVFHFWEEWAQGFIWMHLLYRLVSRVRVTEFTAFSIATIHRMATAGVTKTPIADMNKYILYPFFALALVLIVPPALAIWLLHLWLGPVINTLAAFRITYPLVLMMGIQFIAFRIFTAKFRRWAVALRDREYLVHVRIQNKDEKKSQNGGEGVINGHHRPAAPPQVPA